MFGKTKIFSFLFLFVVSTTGLPITINLCKMAVSEREQCTMHQEPVSSNCCSEETSDSGPSISFDKSSCCQTEFVYKKVEDQYLLNKTNLDFSDDEIFYKLWRLFLCLQKFQTMYLTLTIPHHLF